MSNKVVDPLYISSDIRQITRSKRREGGESLSRTTNNKGRNTGTRTRENFSYPDPYLFATKVNPRRSCIDTQEYIQ